MNKTIFVYILFFSVLSSTSSFSETWKCSYVHDGENKNFVRKRFGQNFIDPNLKNDRGEQIIFENNKQINLHMTFSPMSIDYFAILLDKQSQKFSMIMLETKKSSKLISGQCSILE